MQLVVLLAFVVAGALAAVAGELELARTGSGDPQIGPGFTLSALAAAFLGSTTIRPGQFNVPGTIVGVFFVAVSVNGLTLAGAADWVDPLSTGRRSSWRSRCRRSWRTDGGALRRTSPPA